jgi:uncharacterized protein (DUF433 family)
LLRDSANGTIYEARSLPDWTSEVNKDVNLLATGIYTVSEAAYLLGTTKRKVRGWVAGYGRERPVITNELGWVDDRVAFSFTNLMEMRFIAFFEGAGLRLPDIRAIMNDVRDVMEHPHPFATQQIFRTDGEKIVAEITLKRSRKIIYDLKSKNYEMCTVVLDSLKDDVLYDAAGMARAWYPRKQTAPNVILNPRISFGRPTLRHSRVPTSTIADAVRAEAGDTRAVAKWYEIPESEVREAVRFETALRQAN